MYAVRLLDCFMCLNASIISRDVSAANLLMMRVENSDQDRELVLISVLLSQ
jgi:hypothetical protein